MKQELEMFDVDGNEVKPGDFVMLLKDAPFNQALKKGYVFKVARIWNNSYENLVALTGKHSNGSGIEYNLGYAAKNIKKVQYDLKRRKVVLGGSV